MLETQQQSHRTALEPAHHSGCAIVVPHFRSELTPEERVSLCHLEHYLSDYDIIIAVPEGTKLEGVDRQHVHFSREYFDSRQGYSRLLLSREFYEPFEKYSFILIHQLDCLVFSSDLQSWLDQTGYDYIGSPLFRDPEKPEKGFSRVGNGGLSLRRVKPFFDVIDSPRYVNEEPSMATELLATSLPDLKDMGPLQRMKKTASVLREVRHGSEAYRRNYTLNEDLFWSDRAALFARTFRVAPVETGLQFAFEKHPRYCFERNGGELPFGCHAWQKWDREFWMDHILPECASLLQDGE
ncbi:MAG: hypothetical protein CL946_10585 [Ectothiorhodospiraceae bacterium]|nr:hypothetical protein [Ectothiorhodospiraceae bacterium]